MVHPRDRKELPQDAERVEQARRMTPAARVRLAIKVSQAALRFKHGRRIQP